MRSLSREGFFRVDGSDTILLFICGFDIGFVGFGDRSEEESQDLSSEVLATGLLVVHDAAGRRHHDKTGN